MARGLTAGALPTLAPPASELSTPLSHSASLPTPDATTDATLSRCSSLLMSLGISSFDFGARDVGTCAATGEAFLLPRSSEGLMDMLALKPGDCTQGGVKTLSDSFSLAIPPDAGRRLAGLGMRDSGVALAAALAAAEVVDADLLPVASDGAAAPTPIGRQDKDKRGICD